MARILRALRNALHYETNATPSGSIEPAEFDVAYTPEQISDVFDRGQRGALTKV